MGFRRLLIRHSCDVGASSSGVEKLTLLPAQKVGKGFRHRALCWRNGVLREQISLSRRRLFKLKAWTGSVTTPDSIGQIFA